MGIEQDCEKVVAPVLEQLEGVAAQHMEETQQHDMVIEALDLAWGSIHERLVEARLEEGSVAPLRRFRYAGSIFLLKPFYY